MAGGAHPREATHGQARPEDGLLTLDQTLALFSGLEIETAEVRHREDDFAVPDDPWGSTRALFKRRFCTRSSDGRRPLGFRETPKSFDMSRLEEYKGIGIVGG